MNVCIVSTFEGTTEDYMEIQFEEGHQEAAVPIHCRVCVTVWSRNMDNQQNDGETSRWVLHPHAPHGIQCVMERQNDERRAL